MSKLTKVFLIVVSLLITAQFLNASFLILAPTVSAETPPEGMTATDIRSSIKVPFPDFEDLGTAEYVVCEGSDSSSAEAARCWQIPWIAKYIGNAYRYGLVIGSILAVMMIMIGGIMYMIGGLNQSLISRGKEFIVGAVTGLILLLGSYIMLQTINPNLVHLKPIEVEVVKEQVLLSGKFCSQVADQKTDGGQPMFEVDPSTWAASNTCGQELPVKLTSAGSAGGTQTSGGTQTCISDSCGGTNLACIQDLTSGNYECKAVVMHGAIIYPSAIDQLMQGCEGDITRLLGKGFYVDEIQLYAITGSFLRPISPVKSLGAAIYQYSFSRSDLFPEEQLRFLNDDAQIIMRIQVNDAAWPLWFTIDDDFYVSALSSTVNGTNNVKPVIICPTLTGRAAFSASVDDSGGVTYRNITPLKWGDIKDVAAGIKWDINVTEDFFNCKSGETHTTSSAYCAAAVSVAPATQKYGEECNNNANCVIENHPTNQGSLLCNNNVCTYGVWGDECDTGKSQCAHSFECIDEGTDQCVFSYPKGYLQKCDPQSSSGCAGNEICMKGEVWNEQSYNPLGCTYESAGGETLDTYMCVPAINDVLCECRSNRDSDCPSSHPYCVDAGGWFCSTGEIGTPCDTHGDCKGSLYCNSSTNTCYLPGSYSSTVQSGGTADGGKNLNKDFLAENPLPTRP